MLSTNQDKNLIKSKVVGWPSKGSLTETWGTRTQLIIAIRSPYRGRSEAITVDLRGFRTAILRGTKLTGTILGEDVGSKFLIPGFLLTRFSLENVERYQMTDFNTKNQQN